MKSHGRASKSNHLPFKVKIKGTVEMLSFDIDFAIFFEKSSM